MLLIETGLIILALLIALVRPSLGSSWFESAERRFSALARRRTLAVLSVGVAALALRAAVLPIEPIPEPIVHDEFSYLLAADTFAHGRLTNPTPPMWEHFETFHVMSHPTYASIYPPAQGLMLAFGEVLFGHPFWGVWLSIGLMCASITWMLQGWISENWALLGGFLAVLRYGVFGYWADSYWGGAVAAIGGALVLGALPRIKKSQRVRDALLMGLGLAILANSRPYEGFVLSVPVAIILIAWFFSRKSPPFILTLPRVVLPLTLLLVVSGTWMGYYFWRVTGSPFRMPYQIERQTYAMAPYFVWQSIRPEPTYHHVVMGKMFVRDEIAVLHVFRSGIGLPIRAFLAWGFFLGPAFSLPFIMLAVTAPHDVSVRRLDEQNLSVPFILGLFVCGTLLVNFYGAHYSAPATALVVLALLLATKQLHRWGRSGLFLCRTLPLVCLISLGIRASATPLHVRLTRAYNLCPGSNWYQEPTHTFGREEMERGLLRVPGKHLVIVQYESGHGPFAEWVYNQADIPSARIVWARDMGTAKNRELEESFKDRDVWFLDADSIPLTLRNENTAALDRSRAEPRSKE